MQTEAILQSIEEAVESQLVVGGEGEAMEGAAVALMVALRPAIRQGAYTLAEQAAAEVAAQLSEYTVSVVIVDGEPSLLVREDTTAERRFSTEDLSARITLRLSNPLKEDIEAAADESGDSVNAFIVKALSARAAKKSARRITGTFET